MIKERVCILNNKDTIQNIAEQIGEFVVSNIDPISALTNKIQKHLATLRKQNSSSPRLYGVIKAHKPEKCYAMRALVSTIGTPRY